jgi:hypothetical protein
MTSIYDQFAPGDDDTETLYQERIKGLKTISGDVYTGEFYREMLTWWFNVTDKNRDDYYTTEQPVERHNLSGMIIFPDGTPEAEVKRVFAQEYELARKIGDQRFGITCQHINTRGGYCLNCQRRVI